VLHFFGVPWPVRRVLVPLNDERRSGVLPPLIGYGSKSGLDLTVPYYFNLAPNRDLTLYPRMLSSRGVQLGGDFRYIGDGYSGQIRAELLPDDKKAGRNRWAYSIQHSQRIIQDDGVCQRQQGFGRSVSRRPDAYRLAIDPASVHAGRRRDL
jgi:LPS-assembly protein